jgi:hypothetical protein
MTLFKPDTSRFSVFLLLLLSGQGMEFSEAVRFREGTGNREKTQE